MGIQSSNLNNAMAYFYKYDADHNATLTPEELKKDQAGQDLLKKAQDNKVPTEDGLDAWEVMELMAPKIVITPRDDWQMPLYDSFFKSAEFADYFQKYDFTIVEKALKTIAQAISQNPDQQNYLLKSYLQFIVANKIDLTQYVELGFGDRKMEIDIPTCKEMIANAISGFVRYHTDQAVQMRPETILSMLDTETSIEKLLPILLKDHTTAEWQGELQAYFAADTTPIKATSDEQRFQTFLEKNPGIKDKILDIVKTAGGPATEKEALLYAYDTFFKSFLTESTPGQDPEQLFLYFKNTSLYNSIGKQTDFSTVLKTIQQFYPGQPLEDILQSYDFATSVIDLNDFIVHKLINTLKPENYAAMHKEIAAILQNASPTTTQYFTQKLRPLYDKTTPEIMQETAAFLQKTQTMSSSREIMYTLFTTHLYNYLSPDELDQLDTLDNQISEGKANILDMQKYLEQILSPENIARKKTTFLIYYFATHGAFDDEAYIPQILTILSNPDFVTGALLQQLDTKITALDQAATPEQKDALKKELFALLHLGKAESAAQHKQAATPEAAVRAEAYARSLAEKTVSATTIMANRSYVLTQTETAFLRTIVENAHDTGLLQNFEKQVTRIAAYRQTETQTSVKSDTLAVQQPGTADNTQEKNKIPLRDILIFKSITKQLQEMNQERLAVKRKEEAKESTPQTQTSKTLNLSAAQVGLLRKYGIIEGDPAVLLGKINKLITFSRI